MKIYKIECPANLPAGFVANQKRSRVCFLQIHQEVLLPIKKVVFPMKI
jgi:hypothetical protein